MRGKKSKATTSVRAQGVPPGNLEAIRIIRQWKDEPPEHGAAFWRDLDRELQANRLSLRKPV